MSAPITDTFELRNGRQGAGRGFSEREADGQVTGHLKVFHELSVSYRKEPSIEKYWSTVCFLCQRIALALQTPTL